MALDNYGALIQSGENLVPDVTQQMQQHQMGAAQITSANLANQQSQMQMAMAQRALVRQQQFGQQMQGFVKNPTAEGLAALTGAFPEFAEQAKSAWGPLNESQRRQEATQMGEIATLAANGNGDAAAKLMQARIDADNAAGITRNSEHDQQILTMLKSGDPQQLKGVVALASLASGAAVGWDKAGEWLDSLGLSKKPVDVGPGHSLVTQQGETVASVAPELKDVSWTDAQGVTHPGWFNPQTGQMGNPGTAPGQGAPAQSAPAYGGGQAPAGGTTTPAGAGGMQASVAHVLHNEGGLNKSDMNGSPTNFGINYAANKAELAKVGITSPAQMGNLTQQQAAQIYASKYWPQSGAESLPQNMQAPYFDVYVRNPTIAKKALAQSGGDPAKFARITNAYFQNMARNNPKAAVYAHAWATRDAGNAAIATGQAPNAVPAAGGGQAPAAVASFGPGSTGGIDIKGAPTDMMFTHGPDGQRIGVVPIPGSSTDPNSYSPQEIDDLARTWITTGPAAFASLGGGGGSGGGGGIAQLKKAALARATQMMAQSGITADQLPGLRSKYQGLNTSLQTATTTLSALSAAQDGLKRDAALILSTQAPLVKAGIIKDGGALGGIVSTNFENNTELDWYETHGDPKTQGEIKAYKDAVNAYTQTYTKFMTAANGIGGSAQPSDAKAAKAGELNDNGMGPTALGRHLQTVLAEAENKRAGWQHQVDLIQNHLNGLMPQKVPAHPVNIPQGAVQMLKANPHLAAAFDQKYGAGKASQILGH